MPFSKKILTTLACLVSMVAPAIQAASPTPERAAILGSAAPSAAVEFDVFLRLRNTKELDALLEELQDPHSKLYRKWLSAEAFHREFGATQETQEAVIRELESLGLTAQLQSGQKIHVSGTADAVQRALHTSLAAASYKNGRKTMVATAPIILPSAMAANEAIVAGLDGAIRMHVHSVTTAAAPDNSASPVGPYDAIDLKQAYKFPSFQVLTGKGARIGVLMTNAFNPADMDAYFSHEKLATPHISQVLVDGGSVFDANLSEETHLDLQQSGSMAPNADLTLYNMFDLSDASIMAGLTTIVESNQVDLVNMSFGEFEQGYNPEYNNGVDMRGLLPIYDEIFKQGNAEGITFVASSGDLGALQAPPVACIAPDAEPGCGTFLLSSSFPATNPHVTAVGGTNLVTTMTSNSLDSKYVSEAAFDDPLASDLIFGTPASGAVFGSGGGDSILYSKPSYQDLVQTDSTVRTTPDVSLHMGGCPKGSVLPCGPNRSNDNVIIGGQTIHLVGTSASSPDFVGLLALKIEQCHCRLGNENYDIYALAALQQHGAKLNIFNDDIPGFNGFYHTHKGYNRVLGNGTVNGFNFILGFDGAGSPAAPVAGTPQTPSNP